MDDTGLWSDQNNILQKENHHLFIQQAFPLTRYIVATDNDWLTWDAKEEEVHQVIFQLSPLRALRREGMHSFFFQKYDL